MQALSKIFRPPSVGDWIFVDAGLERGRGRGALDSKGPGTARGLFTYQKLANRAYRGSTHKYQGYPDLPSTTQAFPDLSPEAQLVSATSAGLRAAGCCFGATEGGRMADIYARMGFF